ncbi:copper resistance protein CopC [Nocardioides bizhenqiangii]|uniref:Copper resistance protein CopC n=1 Tax=Nocardioides bizhenqiangii TaxID=3095076 RepID=A0ABZ0ZW44_9ACTN|nr:MULTISPECIES: copper resistance protein CopC [unclassified Nocardioides]MDZ5622905.1 copper resistance protein CopC [Nocardioides sp. HM23]WQQ27887.1 copper resistance protein CopC [Nocardioides sp. HM61]
MIGRVLAAALLAGLLVGSAAAPASAHASLVSTDPAEGAVVAEAPGAVTFTFSEPVSLAGDSLQAYDAAGEPVDVDASARGEVVTADLPDDLADGTYVVAWRVVSSDGHPVAGSLTFHVGAPSETVVPPRDVPATDDTSMRAVASVVQALSYVALLLAGGLTIFLSWTSRGIRLHDGVRRRLLLLQRGSALTAVLVTAVAVVVSGAYQRGAGIDGLFEAASIDPELVGDDLTVLTLQVIGLGLAVLMAGRTTPSLAGDVGAGLAVWSPALVGHTRSYEPVSLLVLTDALHLSAGAVWLGGLVGLAVVLPSLAGRERDGALVLSRFSTVAAVLLGVLAGAGVLLGWRILGSWSGLWETTYGRLLLVKVAIALVVGAVAAFNRYRVLPRVGAGPHEARRRATYAVRRVVVLEAALLVALLGVTGFLVEQPPRAESAAVPVAPTSEVARAVVGELQVLAVLDEEPGRQRQLLVQVQDLAGEPVDLAERPTVSLRSADVDLGTVPVTPTGAGTFQATVTFPEPGEWEVQVSLRVDEFDNPVTTLTVDVP